MIPHRAPTASQPAPPFRSDSEEAPTDSAPRLGELDVRGARWRTSTRGICDMSWGQVAVARMRFWLFDGASSGESRLLLTLRAFPELLKDAAASHWPRPRGWNKNVPVLKCCSLRLRAGFPAAYHRADYSCSLLSWRLAERLLAKPLHFPRSILWNIRRLKLCLIPRKWLFTLYFEIINRRPI